MDDDTRDLTNLDLAGENEEFNNASQNMERAQENIDGVDFDEDEDTIPFPIEEMKKDF